MILQHTCEGHSRSMPGMTVGVLALHLSNRLLPVLANACLRILSRRTRARPNREALRSVSSDRAKHAANRECHSRVVLPVIRATWCRWRKRKVDEDVEEQLVGVHRWSLRVLRAVLWSLLDLREEMDGKPNPTKADWSCKREFTDSNSLSSSHAMPHLTNVHLTAESDTSSKPQPSEPAEPNPTSNAGVISTPWSTLPLIPVPPHSPSSTTTSTLPWPRLDRLHIQQHLVGGVFNIDINSPTPPEDLIVYLVRVSLETSIELTTKRKGKQTVPIQRHKLFEKGWVPPKNNDGSHGDGKKTDGFVRNSGTDHAWTVQGIARMPDDNTIRASTVAASKASIRFSHVMVVEIVHSRRPAGSTARTREEEAKERS